MNAVADKVFSEYEVVELGFILKQLKAVSESCIGTMEEELNTRVITKKCRGVVTKKTVKGTGEGTLKMTLHIKQSLLVALRGMLQADLKEGVTAYGRNSVHANFCLTAKVKDEDGNIKLKAYPNAVIESALTRKIENGAEEVAEIELEVATMPDENGNGLYEAVETDLKSVDAETIKTTWMTQFTPELVTNVA